MRFRLREHHGRRDARALFRIQLRRACKDAVELALGCLGRHAGFQPPDRANAEVAEVSVRVHRYRGPDARVRGGERETRRDDTDDLAITSVQENVTADDGWVGVESAAPV